MDDELNKLFALLRGREEVKKGTRGRVRERYDAKLVRRPKDDEHTLKLFLEKKVNRRTLVIPFSP